MTWLSFKNKVKDFLSVDAKRQGMSTFIDLQIKRGVTDLQDLIVCYRSGHTITYDADDFSPFGEASIARLPAGSMPIRGKMIKIGSHCIIHPLTEWPWNHRDSMVCAAVPIIRGQYWIAFGPQDGEFMVYPQVSEPWAVQIEYDGFKTDFADTDETPFEEDEAEAVANFVAWKIQQRIGADRSAAESFRQTYYGAGREMIGDRMRLYRKCLDQRRFSDHSQDPIPSKATIPVIDEDKIVEFCLFGESGKDDSNSDTATVATLIQRLQPDFIAHLGDLNPSTGSRITLDANLVTHFYGFIPGNFWLAFGDEDLATETGDPLFELLPHVKSANSGKAYYKFSKGPVDFFVYNTDSGEADGIDKDSTQGQWLKDKLDKSTAEWKVVLTHLSPYTSATGAGGGDATLQAIPFKTWGADLVISGGHQIYERMLVSKLQYITSGLGGSGKGTFENTLITESQQTYNSEFGVSRVSATKTRFQHDFVNINGEIIDTLILTK